ncbi:response regulator [Bosea sp. RAF48]|uniref:response regulator n=1 Tax=Bosea sp. RAF48 TaxID=3237480 RepID=UPI003F934E9B
MDERRSIIVVDDHAIFRAGVVQILSTSPNLEVVGQGASASDAVKLAETLRPDLALIDISMPGGGIAAASEIHACWPQVKIVMLTVSEEEHVVLHALEAGASGYALKGIPATQLVSVVHSVLNGESYLPASMAARLVSTMLGRQGDHTPAARIAALSPKEERTLRLLGRGLTNKEIAEATGVQVKTVKFHISNVFSKLGVRSRVEAALFAQKHLV